MSHSNESKVCVICNQVSVRTHGRNFKIEKKEKNTTQILSEESDTVQFMKDESYIKSEMFLESDRIV